MLGLWPQEAKLAVENGGTCCGEQEDRTCCSPFLMSPCFSAIHSPGLLRHRQRLSRSLLSSKQMSWQGPVRPKPWSHVCEQPRCLCYLQAAVRLPTRHQFGAQSKLHGVPSAWLVWLLNIVIMGSLFISVLIYSPSFSWAPRLYPVCGKDNQALSPLPKR